MGTATLYEADLTLRDARSRYFEDNAFGPDGGYQARWVKVSLGPIPMAIPNTAARVHAVRYHDLHHVLTGYATDLRGEAEIAAWELASGCGSMVAAWVLNLYALVIGMLIDPAAVFAAFVRGRHSRNLYGAHFDDDLLDASVGRQRRQLGLDVEPPPVTARDRLAFGAWLTLGGGLVLTTLTLLVGPLVALVWWRVAG